MFNFTDSERAYFREHCAISTDPDGNEVLAGLTQEETEIYMEICRMFLTHDHYYIDRNSEQYLKLHAKHEKARLDAIENEVYHNKENPTSVLSH